MSAEVIELVQYDRHGAGISVCMACKHEEVTIAPIGVKDMECSSCGAMKSNWKYEFRPDEDRRVCNCGNDLFYLTRLGHFCPNCGRYQKY